MKKLFPEYSFSEEQLNSISSLAKETGLTEQITRILYARGVDTAQKSTVLCILRKTIFFPLS